MISGSGRSTGEGTGYPLQYFWASLVAQLVKNLQCRRPRFDPWVGKGKATLSSRGFPCGSDSKASACNAGDPGSVPGSGRFPGEGNGNSLQYSCLENPTDRVAWLATVPKGHKRGGHNLATKQQMIHKRPIN